MSDDFLYKLWSYFVEIEYGYITYKNELKPVLLS